MNLFSYKFFIKYVFCSVKNSRFHKVKQILKKGTLWPLRMNVRWAGQSSQRIYWNPLDPSPPSAYFLTLRTSWIPVNFHKGIQTPFFKFAQAFTELIQSNCIFIIYVHVLKEYISNVSFFLESLIWFQILCWFDTRSPKWERSVA